MDISNRIPKAAEVNQTSQTEQASESQTTSPEAAESSGGITEVTDQIRPGNALNPYAQLFESPTLNPQALPVEALPITQGGTIIPDSLASVDPQQNLPENLQPQSFNLPGIDTKIAPDHFGIDLSAGGLRGKTSLDSILGFGGSGGLQTKGFGMFAGGRDWSLVSDLTTTNTTDKDGNRVVERRGTSGDISLSQKITYKPDGTFTGEGRIAYPDGSSTETTYSGKSDTNYSYTTTFYDENGKKTGEGVVRTDTLGTTVTVKNFDENGNLTKTTTEIYGADGKKTGTVVTDADGTQHVYDADGKEVKSSTDEGTKQGDEYMDPEGGPAVQTNVDPNNFLRIQNVRRDLNITPFNTGDVNTTPSNVDDPPPINIDPKRVYDPLTKPLVTDGNPEYESQVLFGDGSSIDVTNEAKGGDPVNPNDDSAPLAPPTTLPPK